MNLGGVVLGGMVDQGNKEAELGLKRGNLQYQLMQLAGQRAQATIEQAQQIVSALPTDADRSSVTQTMAALKQDFVALSAGAGMNPQTAAMRFDSTIATTPTIQTAARLKGGASTTQAAAAAPGTAITAAAQSGGDAAGKLPYSVTEIKPGSAAIPTAAIIPPNGIGGPTTGPNPTAGGVTPPPAAYGPAGLPLNRPAAGAATAPVPAPGTGIAGTNPQGGVVPNAAGGYTNTNSPLTINNTSVIGGNELASAQAKLDAESVSKARDAANSGYGDMQTIRLIQDFLPTTREGWGAPQLLQAARILQAAGVDPAKVKDFTGTNVTSGQLLEKKFLELSSQAVRAMGAREPGSVISMFNKAYPNLGTDRTAITLQTNAMIMNQKFKQDFADAMEGYAGQSLTEAQKPGSVYKGLNGFAKQFRQSNAPELYVHAAEAMSGVPNGWQRITDPAQQQHVIDLIPSGSQYLAPDGQMRIKR